MNTQDIAFYAVAGVALAAILIALVQSFVLQRVTTTTYESMCCITCMDCGAFSGGMVPMLKGIHHQRETGHALVFSGEKYVPDDFGQLKYLPVGEENFIDPDRDVRCVCMGPLCGGACSGEVPKDRPEGLLCDYCLYGHVGSRGINE